MGKEKRTRRGIRSNPLGACRGFRAAEPVKAIPVFEELRCLRTEEASASLGFCPEELLRKLQSQVPDDRSSAAVILANLSSNPSTMDSVSRVCIIRIAAPLLLDSNIHVRLSISRFLGAISNSGEIGCSRLIAGDVVPIVGKVLEKFVGCDWSKIDKGHTTLLEDSLYLLEKLCGSSGEAVRIFNNQNYIEIVFPMLNVQLTQSFRISAAAGMCLLAVSEDNSDLEERLKAGIPAIRDTINYQHASMSQVFMRALSVALLYNIEGLNSDPTSHLEVIRGVLETPAQDLTALVSEKVVYVTEIEKARELEVENLEKIHKEVDSHVFELSELLRAKKMALEVLTNLCCAEDDGDEDHWNDVDSDGESSQASVDDTMETETSAHPLSPEFMRSIRVSRFLPLVLNHTVDLLPQQNETFKLTEATRSLKADIKDVRSRAYLCIDNMFQGLSIEDFGAPAEVHRLFETLMRSMIEVCKSDKDLLGVTSSAIRGVLDCVLRAEKSLQPNVMACVSKDALIFVCRTCQEGTCASTRMNICRIVTSLALLGSSLAPGAVELLHLVATTDSDMRICAEAFDCIIDLFTEDDYDGIMHEFQLLDKLKQAIPRFESMYRAYPKGESKMLAATCNKNLRRFIKYKNKRRS